MDTIKPCFLLRYTTLSENTHTKSATNKDPLPFHTTGLSTSCTSYTRVRGRYQSRGQELFLNIIYIYITKIKSLVSKEIKNNEKHNYIQNNEKKHAYVNQ